MPTSSASTSPSRCSRWGRERVARHDGRDRIRLLCGRAEQLPFDDGAFDALTFTYLLRYVADPAATLRELARVVRPGGVVSSLEFFVPPAPFWLNAWRLYTRVGLPAAGLVGGWSRMGARRLVPRPVHRGALPPLPPRDARRMWHDAGLEDVHDAADEPGRRAGDVGRKRDG